MKSILTSNDMKNIFESAWNDSDIAIEREEFGKLVKTSCRNALHIDFYCFKKEVRTAHALVKVVKDDALLPPSVDYCEKKALITFLIEDEKANFLDAYVQNLRAKYLGVVQNTEIAGIKVRYLEFGMLQYDKRPEDTAIGRAIVCSMEFKITYAVNVAVAGDKVWLLDGVKLPYIRESVDLEKLGNSNNIYGEKATQTLPTGQSRFYNFTLPYVTDNEICARIQREILEGNMLQVHDLSYYDGITYTSESPFCTKVTLFRTLRSAGKIAENAEFDVVFTDVDDGLTGNTRYEMALIDNPFDAGSVNVRYFGSKVFDDTGATDARREQREWYAEKIEAGAPYSPIKAPNLNSLTITQQVYIKPQECSLDLNGLLTKNYAVIKASDKESGEVLYYYYYYIQSASVGANNQIIVSLNMDTIQTYYFDPKIEIPECMIERAHLNRWVDNGDGSVSFDNGPESPLLINENFQVPKRLMKRIALNFNKIDLNLPKSKINDILAKIQYWVLVFIIPRKPSDENSFFSFEERSGPFLSATINTGIYVAFAPYFGASSCKMKFNGEEINVKNLFDSIKVLNLEPYILNIKITPVCPLGVNTYLNTDYSIEDNDKTINFKESNNSRIAKLKHYEREGKTFNIFSLLSQSYRPVNLNFNFQDNGINLRNTFAKSEINGGNKQFTLNPKMMSASFRELKICDYSQNLYVYDIQKLNASEIKLYCSDIISCDVTKGYIRIADNYNSCYANGCEGNLTGLVYSNDTSIPYSVNQLSQFMANNKNYALMQGSLREHKKEMSNLNMGLNAINGYAGAIGNLASGNFGGSISNTIGTMTGAISTQISTEKSLALSRQMESMTLDNMRTAPESVKNAQGNIFLPLSTAYYQIAKLSMYLEYHEGLTKDMESANDYMHMFGFNYGKLGQIRNYDNIRHYFNYIQAIIEFIDGVSISNDARIEIRRRFSQGIRFWNSDEIQYDFENYENWLN